MLVRPVEPYLVRERFPIYKTIMMRGVAMKKRKQYGLVFVLIACICGSAYHAAPVLAQKTEVGYRKLMLGYGRDRIHQIVKTEFSGEYKVSDEDGNSVVLSKMLIDKPVALIVLVFDQNNILFKINVKMRKDKTNPPPDEAIKVIESKYGPPAKRTIANNLDLTAYWYPENKRYEIFFQNIASWDKFEVQYTDTMLEKRKEAHDKEMNKKPVDKNLDF
jgi:hypothetical protein